MQLPSRALLIAAMFGVTPPVVPRSIAGAQGADSVTCSNISVPVVFGLGWSVPPATAGDTVIGVFGDPSHKPVTKALDGDYTVSRSFTPPAFPLCPGFTPPTLPGSRGIRLSSRFSWKLAIRGYPSGFARATASIGTPSGFPLFFDLSLPGSSPFTDPRTSSSFQDVFLDVAGVLGQHTIKGEALAKVSNSGSSNAEEFAFATSALTFSASFLASQLQNIAASDNQIGSSSTGYTEYVTYSVITPEPASLILVATGASGIVGILLRMRRRQPGDDA